MSRDLGHILFKVDGSMRLTGDGGTGNLIDSLERMRDIDAGVNVHAASGLWSGTVQIDAPRDPYYER